MCAIHNRAYWEKMQLNIIQKLLLSLYQSIKINK